ncbi:hypothetical protein [Terrabacter sp. MAHUQ-38]|uniref:hypothetical protein n=1 Tax=unclassified Terrabacter TaxID=2630222 RepID=UPI00165DCAB7|nr:hypothetical protein [Terrabacter sp. MAHUQ-38]MBC9821158.1 hypothetical protein [Terrabacter sp. MAHUQ-38]
MSALRQHVSSVAEPAFVASVALTVVVLLGSLTASFTDAGVVQVLLTTAAVGVLTAVLASAGRHVVQPLPVRANPTGVAGAVASSSAYWCALDAPSCPHRPRAPGRH